MDKIIIQNLTTHAIIGVHKAERQYPQEIRISVIAYTDTRKTGETDSVGFTVNYSSLTKAILKNVDESRFFTIEALAEALAELCLAHENVQGVTLRIEKPSAIPGAAFAAVEIERFPDTSA